MSQFPPKIKIRPTRSIFSGHSAQSPSLSSSFHRSCRRCLWGSGGYVGYIFIAHVVVRVVARVVVRIVARVVVRVVARVAFTWWGICRRSRSINGRNTFHNGGGRRGGSGGSLRTANSRWRVLSASRTRVLPTSRASQRLAISGDSKLIKIGLITMIIYFIVI